MSHAVLAPSGAHRWLNCPPSARLEEQFPDTSSEMAMEGTFAHKFAEINLLHFIGEISDDEFTASIAEMRKDKFYSKALAEYVDEYVNVVVTKYLKAKQLNRGTSLLLERKVDLSAYVPQCYGHADAIIISDNNLEICDLKYGAGVKVDAKNNPQLRLYALGAYDELGFLFSIGTVTVTIVQPRNGGVSSETLSVAQLMKWGELIKPIAKLAFDGKGEFKAGEHCKFCRASNICKHHADYQLEVVKDDFDDPDILSDTEISKILARADNIIKWLNNVKDFALKEAIDKNKHWAGFKIVEGRSIRKIIDENKAVEILQSNGATDNQIWKPKEILGLTALEKNFGKKKIAEWLSGVIQKPPGKPALVPESDERQEWQNAQSDFDNLGAGDG